MRWFFPVFIFSLLVAIPAFADTSVSATVEGGTVVTGYINSTNTVTVTVTLSSSDPDPSLIGGTIQVEAIDGFAFPHPTFVPVGAAHTITADDLTAPVVIPIPQSDLTALQDIELEAVVTDSASTQTSSVASGSYVVDLIPPRFSHPIATFSTAPDPTWLKIGDQIRFSFILQGVNDPTQATVQGSYNGHVLSWSQGNAKLAFYTVTEGDTDQTSVPLQITGVTFTDEAGNPTSNEGESTSVTRLIDAHAPTVVLTSTNTDPTDTPLAMTATFSEPVSDFDASDVQVDNGAVTGDATTTDNTIYMFTITPTAEGAVTVSIPVGAALDVAGNQSIASDTFTLTYTAPVADESPVPVDETPDSTPAPVQSSGGGGGGGVFVAPSETSSPATPAPESPSSSAPVSAEPSSAQGEVLGAETFNFANNLYFGLRGNDVIELHKILIADGYLQIDQPTGYFGPLTFAAVKQYQSAHGIVATGFAGPLTREALNSGS